MKHNFIYIFLGISLCVFGQHKSIDFRETLTEFQESNALEQGTDWPLSLYEKYRETCVPSNGKEVALNPTTFFWKTSEIKNAKYRVQYSSDRSFPTNKTKLIVTSYGFFNLHKKQKPGTWYWKYKEIHEGVETDWFPTNSYKVLQETTVFETPYFKEFSANIPSRRPYLLTYGQTLENLRSISKKNQKICNEILKNGEKILNEPVLRIRSVNKSKYTKRNFLHNVMHPELTKLKKVTMAFLISGDNRYFENARTRVQELFTWDEFELEEMFNADRFKIFAMFYDTFYKELENDLKSEIVKRSEQFLDKMNQHWIGVTENRQYNNHFWQKELSGYFFVAIAIYKESDIAKKSLEYAYEIFLAKSPVLGGNDGGWANGLPYFGVNTGTVIDMAYLIHKVGNVNIFDNPWYQNLSKYYFYCSPAGAPIDGFGDMHERRNNDGLGAKHSLYLSYPTKDPIGMYQFYKTYKPKKDRSLDNFFLTTGYKYEPSEIPRLKEVPQDRLFKEIGEVAMHTNILNPSKDLGLYFRSSPYGANGHMHANQNCFNLSYKGERVFYSSGYYTSFSDPHSLTSYKHTRAHNGIVINGKGQAYGNEGYGWIKRQISGEEISYVCGDASQAYKNVTDEQWSDLIAKNTNKETGPVSANFEDNPLITFDRHLVLLRKSNIVLIYDVIESSNKINTNFLLHTPLESTKKSDNTIQYTGKNAIALATIFSSQETDLSISNQFYVKPVDFKKKYKKGVPNQYHISSETSEKSTISKYLTIIQLGDVNEKLEPITMHKNRMKFKEWEIKVNLKKNNNQCLQILGPSSSLYIGDIPEKIGDVFIKNIPNNASLLIEKNKNGKLVYQGTVNQKPVLTE